MLRQPRSRFLREGDVLWTYFVLYGTARFLIERMRTDSLYIGPLPAAYWVSGGLILLGAGMMLLRHTVWPASRVESIGGPVPQHSARVTGDRRPSPAQHSTSPPPE